MIKAEGSLDRRVAALMAEHNIPGLAVLIAREGVPQVSKGFGLANVELSVPVTPDTVFEIASVTKLFTAQAVMQLVERGLVALDASVREYLLQLPAAWEAATIRHILTHSSGIPNYTDLPEYWTSTRLDVSREQILGLVIDKPLRFPAGSDWSYSNTGYYLLGILIEAVSGQSYGDYLREHIFDPLGMSATRLNDPYQIIPWRAAGYTWQDGELRNAEYYSPSGTYAAGQVMSTIVDLAKWDAALYGDAILPQSVLHSMWEPTGERKPAERGGGFTACLGWFVFDELRGRPMRWAGHNGGIKGFSSAVKRLLDENVTAILLINRDGFDRPDSLLDEILLDNELRIRM